MAEFQVRPGKSRKEFQRALTVLASDGEFRAQATKDPRVITRKFKLSLTELESLREVAIMSGADVTAVNKARVQAISERVTSVSATDIDVSCCSCCCCCCGETAVAPMMYSAG